MGAASLGLQVKGVVLRQVVQQLWELAHPGSSPSIRRQEGATWDGSGQDPDGDQLCLGAHALDPALCLGLGISTCMGLGRMCLEFRTWSQGAMGWVGVEGEMHTDMARLGLGENPCWACDSSLAGFMSQSCSCPIFGITGKATDSNSK